MSRLLMALALLALAAAASTAGIAGTWQVHSTAEGGDEMEWKLVLQEEDGKLSGTYSSELGDFPLQDIRFEHGTLTFRVVIDSENYTAEMRISGSDLEGEFKSVLERGTLKGKKQS